MYSGASQPALAAASAASAASAVSLDNLTDDEMLALALKASADEFKARPAPPAARPVPAVPAVPAVAAAAARLSASAVPRSLQVGDRVRIKSGVVPKYGASNSPTTGFPVQSTVIAFH
jgi:hypothetical protein